MIVNQRIGPRSGLAGAINLPAVAGIDQAQISETEVQHGARDSPNVLTQLRADQNNRRGGIFFQKIFHNVPISETGPFINAKLLLCFPLTSRMATRK
jgi:hypothetical protein